MLLFWTFYSSKNPEQKVKWFPHKYEVAQLFSISWNQLPEEKICSNRCVPTVGTFKSRQTHLFSCAFNEWALCRVWLTDFTLSFFYSYITAFANTFVIIYLHFIVIFISYAFFCDYSFLKIHFCKSLQITIVCEMCYSNKLALPCCSYCSFV